MKTSSRKTRIDEQASQGTWRLVGHVAVDSGQLLITDPAYLGKYVDDDFDGNTSELSRTKPKPSYSYSGCCVARQSKTHCGQTPSGEFKGAGFVAATGYGDGTYPVYVSYNKEGRVASIKIVCVGQ